MSELKPCPFCGGEARLLLNAKRKIYGKDEYRTGVVACCNVCEAGMFYGSEKLAIEAWNRREGDAHTIEPERRKGKWTKENACEFCGFQPWFERDIHTLSFCPNCGADMRGEEDE